MMPDGVQAKQTCGCSWPHSADRSTGSIRPEGDGRLVYICDRSISSPSACA